LFRFKTSIWIQRIKINSLFTPFSYQNARAPAVPGASKHCQPPRKGRISVTVILCCARLAESGIMPPMKYWEIIADKLSAAGWSWGYCSAVTKHGWRWMFDPHREGRRYHCPIS
jgi:hypothetical protein